MTTTLVEMAIAAMPFLAMAGLLRLADHVQRRRDARYAQQIALTDAIHRELGAVAAPTVRQRRGGGWVVSMMAPLDRPATVTALLRVTEEMFGSRDGSSSGSYEIVLKPQPIRPRSVASGARHPAIEKPAREAA